jgi:hypothetical protein
VWPQRSLNRTDEQGYFRIGPVAHGIQDFELYCPSRTIPHPPLLAKRIYVRTQDSLTLAVPGMDPVRIHARTPDSLVMNLQVDASLCAEPPYREVTGEFRGVWSTVYGKNAFSVCADNVLAISSVARRFGDEDNGWSNLVAWVMLTGRAVGDWQRFEKSISALSDSARMMLAVGTPVQWHGTLKGPGEFGPMGQSAYEMIVDSVQSIGSDDTRVCQHPRLLHANP